MKSPLKAVADSFREMVSGSPDGKPAWVKFIEEGEDEGYFGPESAVWQVHGSVATLMGGIRALLLQAAHPAALAGVATHSRYETDLLGRLEGTSRWLTITTFGSKAAISREGARVNEMHKKVSGEYETKDGRHAPYAARDPRFLLWVHCAFTESFLYSHLACGYPIQEGPDAYVREWQLSGQPLGLMNAPASVAELKSTMDEFMKNELSYTATTKMVVDFIVKPPFGRVALFFYGILLKAAIITLTDAERELLHLRKPAKFWLSLAKLNLKVLKIALGNKPPAEDAARRRIARLRNPKLD
jgi:uncharacterized protein (DUF2236 family)